MTSRTQKGTLAGLKDSRDLKIFQAIQKPFLIFKQKEEVILYLYDCFLQFEWNESRFLEVALKHYVAAFVRGDQLADNLQAGLVVWKWRLSAWEKIEKTWKDSQIQRFSTLSWNGEQLELVWGFSSC